MAGSDLQRKNIRTNLASLLSGNTDASSNVFTNRSSELYESELSTINISTPEDVCLYGHKHAKEFTREVRVLIEVLAQRLATQDEPSDVVDTIIGQIEDIILPNEFLQFPAPKNLQTAPYVDAGDEICDSVRLNQITEAKSSDGRADIAGSVMDFTVEYTYTVKVGNVDDLETVDTQYDLEGEQDVADQAHDRFSITQ